MLIILDNSFQRPWGVRLFSPPYRQTRAANPGRKIDLEVQGDTCGSWDSQRLQQLLGNLVRNAIKYGAPVAPVYVGINGDATDVVLEVRNSGPVIEPSDLVQIFDPLKRGSDNENKRDTDGSLGLGLYIVREIAKGHGGSIEARSDQTETVFAVRLPRRCETFLEAFRGARRFSGNRCGGSGLSQSG